MPAFNIFKKKKPEKEKEEKKVNKFDSAASTAKLKPIEEQKKVKEEKPKKKKIAEEMPRKTKEKKGLASGVLRSPQITEKATNLAEKNQYVFKVWTETNKPEIKKAVEGLYDVDVMSVQIINVGRKKRRLGKITGWRPGYKKAIVRIKEGQKIEVMPR